MKSASTLRTVVLGLTLATAPLMLAACEREGPAERTGEAIDDAARSAGDRMEEAGENLQDRRD